MYRVILVDDEKFILVSLEKRVRWQAHGFEVVGKTTSAGTAAEMIETLSPDVVFTDIRMPGESGIELMRQIHEKLPEIKFVVISGYAEFEYAKAALEYGASGYCVKPFEEEDIHELLNKIKKELDAKKNPVSEQLIDFIGSSRMEDIARKTAIMAQRGILEHSAKILLVIGKESGFIPQWEIPYIHFSVNGHMDGYIVQIYPEGMLSPAENASVNSQRSEKGLETLFPDPPESVCIGASRVFFDTTGLEDAFSEAKLSYYQFLINGRYMNVYNGEDRYSLLSDCLKDLSKFYDCHDIAGVKRGFSDIKSLFQNALYTVEAVYRVYTTLLSMTDLQSDTSSGYHGGYDKLASEYKSVYEMLDYFEGLLCGQLAEQEEGNSSSGTIKKILEYIGGHYYEENLSVQTISNQFGFNPNYISQMFKKQLGENFTSYLSKIRMKRAAELLLKSDCTIGEIAEKVGYSDYFYFAKVFKKLNNKTPSEFRTAAESGKMEQS